MSFVSGSVWRAPAAPGPGYMLEVILRRRVFPFLLAAAIPNVLLSTGLAYRALQAERLSIEGEAIGPARALMVRFDREFKAQIHVLDLLADFRRHAKGVFEILNNVFHGRTFI